MSTLNPVPTTPSLEDLLRMPGQQGNNGASNNTSSSTAVENILKTATLEDTIDSEVKQTIEEIHHERMCVLREQKKFLRETEWRYKPIDILIGCLTDTRFL